MSYVDWQHTSLRRRIVCACALALVMGGTNAAELTDIVAVPAAGQTAERARRDRYECHNWAVAQNGTVPAAGPTDEEAARERRAARVSKVITGAAAGAAAGSVIRGVRDHRDADDGALAGGVLGAIAGAVIGGKRERDREEESFDAYFRALDACMTARGYNVSIDDEED